MLTRARTRRCGIWGIAALLLLLQPALAVERTPVLFDTDLGTGIDDAFALGLILSSPELELRGVTTVGGGADT